MLTIAIPTYDRAAALAKTVAALVPQLGNDCRLMVLDNASPTLAAEVLAEYGDRVTIVRNRVNVGGIANVLKCFEACETEWLWVLGDDDLPTPDAIEQIRRAIETGVDFVNFSSEIFRRDATVQTTGVAEFVDGIDHFGNVLFLSSGVYRVERFIPHLRFGYHYGTSMMPHLVMLLMGLGDDGRTIFSSEQIVHWEAPSHAEQWSAVNETLGKGVILDLPISAEVREALGRKLGLPSVPNLMVQILLTARAQGPSEARYFLDQALARSYYFQRRTTSKFRRAMCRLMIRVPQFSLAAAATATRLTGRGGFDQIQLRDRVRRM